MAINTTSVAQDIAQVYKQDGPSKVSAPKSEYGKTVGEPKLSEEGKKYYEELKNKYKGYDFILVSKDQVANAKASAAKYANPLKPVVLIDEEKIERMATDPEYRKKYEAIISGAGADLNKLKDSIASTGANVAGFGIQVNDGGTASYFAVLKKSGDAQSERIKEHRVKAKEAAKAAKKKADKKHREEEIKQKRQDKAEKAKTEKAKEADITDEEKDKIKGDLRKLAEDFKAKKPGIREDDFEVISASSIEELTLKLEDHVQNTMVDSVRTEQEMMVGSTIDFKG